MDICHGMNGGDAKKGRAKKARGAKRDAQRMLKEPRLPFGVGRR